MMYNLAVERPYSHILTVWEEVLASLGDVEGYPLTIRTALAGDSLLLDLRKEQLDTFNTKDVDYLIRAHAWLMLLSPMNYTVFHGVKILLMISVIPTADGVAEISFLTDNNLVTSSKRVKLAMIKAFRLGLEELPFRRLQAKVKEGFDIGLNFVEKLGFSKEGVLTQYGPEGDNYIMYGKVR